MEVGRSFELDFEITEQLWSGFIHLFRDRNPLHTDEAFAQKKGFKGKVMHGNILNGFLSYLIGEQLPTRDVIIHKQTISFHKPFFLGDQIRLNAEVTAYHDVLQVVSLKYAYHNQSEEMIAKGTVQIGII